MTTTEEQILELGRCWAEAEQKGDIDALDAMAVEDFTFVGPFGFILDRAQWLYRYRTGDLVTKSLRWHDVTVREYGTTAVAVGVHTQEASYRGNPNDGDFRNTQIFVSRNDTWLLAGMHMSPMGLPG